MTDGRRVCLFTGASGTLGRDFLTRYAAAYDLVAVYHDTPPAAPTHEPWPARGPGADTAAHADAAAGRVFALRADLFDEDAVAAVVARVLEHFGSVDLLVNAAAYSVWAPLLDGDDLLESLDWQFHMNVVVPARLVAGSAAAWAATPEENRARRRNVVNLSSRAGHEVFEGYGQSGYAASKAALDMLTRHLASELAPLGVRVNALAPDAFPGLVPTERVSDAVVALDRGDGTGQIVDVGP